jgi:3-oxoacyl-[acyl-carrier protein] reductase
VRLWRTSTPTPTPTPAPAHVHAPDDFTRTLPNPNAPSAPADARQPHATPRIATQFIYRSDLPQATSWVAWGRTPLTSWNSDMQPAVRFIQDTTGFGALTYPGHDPVMGRAADIRPNSSANGTGLANWLMANTGPLGIPYIVWSGQIYNIARASDGVRYLADQSSVTQNHMNHVHVSFRTPGPISVNPAAVRPWNGTTIDYRKTVFAGCPDIRRGSTGTCVRDWQHFLNLWFRIRLGKLAEDTGFGAATEAGSGLGRLRPGRGRGSTALLCLTSLCRGRNTPWYATTCCSSGSSGRKRMLTVVPADDLRHSRDGDAPGEGGQLRGGRSALDLELAGRTALVIGGSRGIGSATVEVLAEEGCDVALTYRRSLDGATRSVARAREHARRAWAIPLDLGTPESIAAAADELAAGVGPLDVVVLSAGQNVITPFARIGVPEWREVLDVNLTGVFFAVQAIAPLMRPGGAIVTVASVAAHTGAPRHMHYAAAKAGLVNLTRSLARELAPDIRVNCVAPGITLTPMGKDAAASLAPDYAATSLLLRRFAEPRRLAQTIAVVASPIAEYMTGAVIDVNSGRFPR